MNRFARRLIAAIAIVPALLLANANAALAYPDPGGRGDVGGNPVLPSPPPVDLSPASGGLGGHAQWIVAGAGIVLAVLVVYVAAAALVHRHQQNGKQLRST